MKVDYNSNIEISIIPATHPIMIKRSILDNGKNWQTKTATISSSASEILMEDPSIRIELGINHWNKEDLNDLYGFCRGVYKSYYYGRIN
jgi:hypothetical protein